MADPREEHVYLHSTKDGANKDYNLHLEPDPVAVGMWQLMYENGPHGAALKRKPKLKEPVPYETAKKEFDKTVREKMTKGGYEPQGAGVAYQDVVPAERKSGIEPQLLEAIPIQEVRARMGDSRWMWQEKMDGERRPIRKTTNPDGSVEVIGTNREGLVVPIPKVLADAVAALPIPSCTLDGEDMGQGRYAAFDLISCPDDPAGQRGYGHRREALLTLLRAAPSNCWIDVPTADTPAAAAALASEVHARDGEGLVGKRRDAPYSPGKTAEDAFKWPFLDRVTCFVESHEGTKRSVNIAVFNETGETVPLKKVTIPANFDIPPVGAVVDVEYLYAHRTGGLAQPRYKGVRGDRRLEHCVYSQLKFRGADNLQALSAGPDLGEDFEQEETEESIAPGC